MEAVAWTGDIQRDMYQALYSEDLSIHEDFIRHYQLKKYLKRDLEKHHIFRGFHNSPWAANTLTAAIEACFYNLSGLKEDYTTTIYETLYVAICVRMLWIKQRPRTQEVILV